MALEMDSRKDEPRRIETTEELVNYFKTPSASTSGNSESSVATSRFSRLTAELLEEFQKSEGLDAFKERVAEIVERKLDEDPKMLDMTDEALMEELMEEVQRYPVIPRAIDTNSALGRKQEMNRQVVRMLNDIMAKNERRQDRFDDSPEHHGSGSSDSEAYDPPPLLQDMDDMEEMDRPKRSSLPAKPLTNGHRSRDATKSSPERSRDRLHR